MNGRVYDPELGRFMSADPYIQAPYNSQSYNRYSYVFNNPLSFTDPTGFTTQSGCDDTGCITVGSRDKGCGTADYCITGTQAGHFADAYRNHMDRANNYFVDYSGGYLDAAAYVGLAVVDELVFSDFVIAIDAAIQSDYKTFASSMVFAVAKPVKGAKIVAEKTKDGLATRREVFRKIKRDFGIPKSAKTKVAREALREDGKPVMKDGKVIETRMYEFEGTNIVIKEHSLGHKKGNQGPHFNVTDNQDGKVPGAEKHYYFK